MVKVIKLQSCDGEMFEVDQETVSMCTTVKNMLRGKSAFRNSLGGQFSIDGSYVILKKEGRVLASLTKNSDEEAIVALPDVRASTLEKVIEYCKFHSQAESTEREKKNWDADFVQVKQSVLCELASASYYLDIKPLVNLTSRAIATQISGKTSEEIRETFCNINYEVYAPVFATSLATRCRLQRKFNKKKQQEKDGNKNNSIENDTRSVDELLSFIDGPQSQSNMNNNTNSPATVQPKKKKLKKKDKKKRDGSNSENSSNLSLNSNENQKDSISPGSSSSTPSEDDDDEDQQDFDPIDPYNPDFWEEEGSDDDLDPEMKAALDREVEEFRQRLESMNSQKNNISK